PAVELNGDVRERTPLGVPDRPGDGRHQGLPRGLNIFSGFDRRAIATDCDRADGTGHEESETAARDQQQRHLPDPHPARINGRHLSLLSSQHSDSRTPTHSTPPRLDPASRTEGSPPAQRWNSDYALPNFTESFKVAFLVLQKAADPSNRAFPE